LPEFHSCLIANIIETAAFAQLVAELLDDGKLPKLQAELVKVGDLTKNGGGIRVIYYLLPKNRAHQSWKPQRICSTDWCNSGSAREPGATATPPGNTRANIP